ncbi:MAG TPA: lysozyme inhibitor LprI family protein [Flavobacterium sp.]
MKKITCLLFLLFTVFSFSQSVTGEDELYNQYEKADKELNIVYKKLKSKLTEKQKIELTDAQKAWIKFRDLNCKFISQGGDDGGGPYENKIKIDCLTQSTLERTKELKDLLEDF